MTTKTKTKTKTKNKTKTKTKTKTPKTTETPKTPKTTETTETTETAQIVARMPTRLERALETFAYHCGEIVSAHDLVGFGLAAQGTTASVYATVEIVRREPTNPLWDQCAVNGVPVGNRCAARDAYARLCAPVIAAAIGEPNVWRDAFVGGYIDAMLWSSTDGDDNPLDSKYSRADLAPEALAIVERDCDAFYNLYCRQWGEHASQAGHDFWLSRCGHGAGFFDREGIYRDRDLLQSAARAAGEQWPQVGNDGLIYL